MQGVLFLPTGAAVVTPFIGRGYRWGGVCGGGGVARQDAARLGAYEHTGWGYPAGSPFPGVTGLVALRALSSNTRPQ